MDNEKTTDRVPEVKDTDMDEVAGGVIPRQPEFAGQKTCFRCKKPIPANSMYNYCDDCLKFFEKEGVQFFV